jgi:peptidoglycan/LPS O-acetylase OafA/YrhL
MEKNSPISFLRGLSALWVVIAHCCIWGGFLGYVPNPKVAVDIFMMISGFLMMYTVDRSHINESFHEKRNWIKFYLRRFFRISPAYYLSLVIAFSMSPLYQASYQELDLLNHRRHGLVGAADFGISNFIYHITYVFGLIPRKVSSTFLPDWSLSLEMQFYLIFPFIFLFFKKKMSILKLIIVTIVFIAISYFLKHIFIKGFPIQSLSLSFILYQLPFFMIGVLIYFSTQTPSLKNKITSLTLAVILCIYSILTKYGYDSIYLLLASTLLAFTTVNHPIAGKIKYILDNKFIDLLSDLSFSVYLLHGFFLAILGSFIERELFPLGYSPNQCVILIILCVVPLVYFFAFLSYRFIEIPGIKLGKEIIKRYISTLPTS